MKILQVHNRYLSGSGGEDVAVEADRALLEERGHEVTQFFGSNAEFGTARGLRRVALGANAIWSHRSYAELRKQVERCRPTVVHVHNTFAQLSGSVSWALAQQHVAVVQTVQNYRSMCATATLFRDGRPCDECVGRLPYPALIHGCGYNDSHAAGLVISGGIATHAALKTLTRNVHAVIALTEFMKSKLRDAGYDEARLHIRPNFLPDPGCNFPGYEARSNRIVFVGRMVNSKGASHCAQAWALADEKAWRLLMIGDGQQQRSLAAAWGADRNVEWTGKIERTGVLNAMAASRYLVVPSLWYEGLPLVLVEAMSCGTPVIVPDHGAFPEIVEDGVNGIVFKAGDVMSLRDALRRAMSLTPHEWARVSRGARSRFLQRYSSDVAYERLMSIYAHAMDTAQVPHA
ncbi:MAG: glycosyltransferase family 4 protein [bacterium]